MFKVSRLLFIYLIAVPLAVLVGYWVSSEDYYGIVGILLVVGVLVLPIFLKWHHLLLIVCWNSAFNAYFLPGHPDFWLLMALGGFTIAMLNHIIFQKQFLRVPEMTWSLVFMAVVVLGTAFYRGGFGLKAFGGGTYGGRYYIFIFGAMAGYVALTSQRIPISGSLRMAQLYFLPGVTFGMANLVYVLGPAFYSLYYLFPPDSISSQVASDWGMTDLDRILGLGPACVAVLCCLLAACGIKGIFDWSKPWRMILFCCTIAGSMFAGFRSILALICLILAFEFYFEGLHRTRLLSILLAIGMVGLIPVLLFAGKMPKTVQRTLSFLPLKLSAEAVEDARMSSEWRFQMWSVVEKEIGKYLLIGKGYSIDPTELFLMNEGARMGILTSYEATMLAGDYHSGPLSVIIPFGIPGVVAFLWVLGAGFSVLLTNYRNGDPHLRRINSVLLSVYLAYAISFVFIFGAFNTELPYFLGAAGMSVSLNGGVRRRPVKHKGLPSVPESRLAVGLA